MIDFASAIGNPRRREAILLFLAGTFLLINTLILILGTTHDWMTLWLFAIWVGAAVFGHRRLNRFAPQRDPFLYPIAMLLTGWGVLLIQRLAPNFAWRQALWLMVSLAALLLVSAQPNHLRWLRRYRYTWLFGGLALLLVTILLGVNPSGSGPRLWLGAAGVYFQPSELLKLVLVIFLASYLADHRDALRRGSQTERRWALPSPRAIGPLLLMWGLCMVLVIWQRDLGTATLFFAIFLALLYVASGEALYVLTGLVLLLVAALAAYRLFDVVQLRVDIWLNPWPEADERAFQIVQSLMAFASGGVVGQGIGLGSPIYIPVVHSDFIFSAVGEEWGLVGTLGVLVCLATLALRGFRLAAMWPERRFHFFLASGLSVLLATQSILITGGVLKLLPLTGVTVPFMSYGGSSLLINFVVIGLFVALSSPPPPAQEGIGP